MSSMDYMQKKKIVCGITFVLLLTLLCLFTNLFAFYKNFLLGVFGLVTYPAVILGIAFCVLYLANKVIKIDKKSLTLSIIIFSLFLCILQLALTSGYNFESFSSYISTCYSSKTAPAGALLGIIVFPFKYLFFEVGAYIIFAVAIVAFVAYTIDYYLYKYKSGQAAATIQKRVIKNDPIKEIRDNVTQTPKSFASAQSEKTESVEDVKENVGENTILKDNIQPVKENNPQNNSSEEEITSTNSKFEQENKNINDKIKAKLGLIEEKKAEEQKVDDEFDNKSDAFKTLYSDKYKTSKTRSSSLDTNYLSNSLNRYFDTSSSNKKVSEEYKNKYKEYTNQKVEIGYDYLNDGVSNSNASDGIISGDNYKENKSVKKEKIFTDNDKKKANDMFETMKEPPKHLNTEEIHYNGCTILKDAETFVDDTYTQEESDDITQNSVNNQYQQYENNVADSQFDDFESNTETNTSNVESERNSNLQNENKPVLRVDEEAGINIEDLEKDNDYTQANRATILPNSEDLAINKECESENDVNNNKLIDDFEEVEFKLGAQDVKEDVQKEEIIEEDNEAQETEEDENIQENEKVEPVISNNSFTQVQENTFVKKPVVNKVEEQPKEEVYIPPKPYNRPSVDFLTVESTDMSELIEDTEQKSQLLEQALESFKVPAKVSNVVVGPTVTRYEMTMPAGISVKRIIGYSDDIAMTLASRGAIRIEAPIPGKNAVGIEVPNEKGAVIGFKEVFESGEFDRNTNPLNFVLGKDIGGKFVFCNLAKAPHLIVAGSTGSGKSVCLNILILSIIYKSSPEDVRIILVDPKRVEFANYAGLPHLMIPQIITEPDKAVNVLQWAINEMEKRYTLFQSHRVRDIGEYNALDDIVNKKKPKMPYIVMIVDELADLMSVAKKDIEDKIARLAAKARSAGIHLVLATQRPSIDVITGTIKNNFPTRIAFSLTTAIDSKTVLDQGGAEKLLGRGDMLYSPQDQNEPTRIQAPFVTGKEIDDIVSYVKSHNEARYDDKVTNQMLNKNTEVPNVVGMKDPTEDEMFVPALKCFIEANQASSSMLQRRLGIGWNRAAKLTDAIEELGYIGKPDGNNKRQILITKEQFRELYGDID